MTTHTLLMRYRYPDGSLQAALPMHVVSDTPEAVVGWLPPGSEISYWATSDGSDPRTVPLDIRFDQDLGTVRRSWTGGGVLKVIPPHEYWQVLHFWDPETGEFMGWYVNLESKKSRARDKLDAVDWHLDLMISPSFEVTWKDEDEAEAAARTPYLRSRDLETGRRVGEAIASSPKSLIERIGDWSAFVPAPEWGPLKLPADWDD
jgi:hypothetical protein